MSIIQHLKQNKRLEIIIILMFSCLLSVGLIALRIMATHRIYFLFLIWNLFLAFIPFFIANWLIIYKNALSKYTIIPFVALWLLFFPNAPYIITDLIHVRPDRHFGYWYDLLIVISCVWNALVMGLISLYDIQEVITEKIGKFTAWLVIIASTFLAAFGIYLGRVLRWNSWDIFFDTKSLMFDIGTRIANPLQHGFTFGITLFYGLFLLMVYLFFRQLMVHRAK